MCSNNIHNCDKNVNTLSRDNVKTVVRINPCGNNTVGIKKLSDKTKKADTNNLVKARQSKGYNGISKDAKMALKNGISFLFNDCLLQDKPLYWLVLTFANLPIKTLDKIARNPDLFRAILRDKLNKIGSNYVMNIGIQHNASYNRKIPCYDVNTLSPYEYVTDKQINGFYSSLGKQINERVKLPDNIYREPINNKPENIKQITGYFVDKQVKHNSIYQDVQKWGYPLPKTWHIIPNELKEKSQPITIELEGDRVSEVNAVLEDNGYTIGKNLGQGNAGFKNDLTDYDKESIASTIKTALNA